MKCKFGQISSKIKAPLNLHKNSHNRQFGDCECKYDMIKGFSNSNPDLRKCSSSVQLVCLFVKLIYCWLHQLINILKSQIYHYL